MYWLEIIICTARDTGRIQVAPKAVERRSMKSALKAVLLALLCILLFSWAIACGDEETDTTTADQQDEPAATAAATDEDEGDGDETDPFDAVSEIEATVEVTVNGETTVIWSQKDDHWRWQDPEDPESYVIYNADEDKLWVVNDKVAQESAQAGEDSMYWAQSPAGMLGLYRMIPGGTYSDDTFELSIPGEGKLVVEFKGPEGLPSSFTLFDASGNEEESITFQYSDVGNVPDDLFVLPADVTVQVAPEMPEIPGGMPEIPDIQELP